MMILRCFLVIFLSVTNAYDKSEKGKGPYKHPLVCTKAPDHGPCRANVTYWFFQGKYRECKLFNYGGCAGNGNRFWTEKKCYNRCAAADRRKLLCSVQPEPKPCNSTFQAWYFDDRGNACHRLPRGMCTSSVNRFLWCEKCMRRCSVLSVEDARETCRREYKIMQEEENSIKQGHSPASTAPGVGATGTLPRLPSPAAGLPALTPPLEGATQGQPENVPRPVGQVPTIPVLVVPVPTPDLAGKVGQSGILPHENGGIMRGTTGAAPGAGGILASLTPHAQQTNAQGGTFLGGLHVVSPTAEGSGSLSETNSLEGGSPGRVLVVAVVKPTNKEHDITSPEMTEQSGETTDEKPGIKRPPFGLPRIK
ncbi:uncharacterized protein LOC119373587 [Rhipicephalus sanguineus]|uniref:uncharacterized protein LOC119373587 n=1 Tax=Rhipicephalus sanguineus TaxID=34632 RepID=UPI001895858B|nr:uncharacterized protein LOC119373587 [Rhipicephalus sanguineus]